jgi:hypothetical protein
MNAIKYCKFAALLAAILAPATLTTACDDGPVYEKTTTADGSSRAVTLTGTLTGWDHWTDGYTVVLAGFKDGSDYAVISKPITAAEGPFTLSQIPDEVTTVELCVINSLRQRVATFEEMDFSSQNGMAMMEVGTKNVSMFQCIQQQVFNTTCANCHGGSSYAAAGLYLTEGRSHAALVGQPSKKVEGGTLVKSGNAAESILPQVLGSTLSKSWRYDHSKEVLSADLLDILNGWINGGAEE